MRWWGLCRGLAGKDWYARSNAGATAASCACCLPGRSTALHQLANLHLEELKRIRLDIEQALEAKPKFIKPAEGA